jgi:hypothetical protein
MRAFLMASVLCIFTNILFVSTAAPPALSQHHPDLNPA